MPNNSNGRPVTYQRDLAKLPQALAPLIMRSQWTIWRWTQKSDGSWQKPPFMVTEPERHVSTTDPSTWASYDAAVAAVLAKKGDGITYVLTPDDPFGALDLDHCRDPKTCSIDFWAQNFLLRAQLTYVEVTPSGCGLRIWGLAAGDRLHRKFTLKTDKQEIEKDKLIAVELFRRTHKALTITGYRLGSGSELTNIDKLLDWAVIWGERRKAQAAAAEEAARAANGGNGFDSSGCKYSIEEIERFVREVPPEENRSNLFHAIVGHYVGCGWKPMKIFEHLQQFSEGVGGRYIGEGRLSREIARSAEAFGAASLKLFDDSGGDLSQFDDWDRGGALLPLFAPGGWINGGPAKEASTPQPQPITPPPPPPPSGPPPWEDNPELEEDDVEPPEDKVEDPELEDDELEDDDELDEPPSEQLPTLHAHGSHEPRTPTAWLVKHIIPARGHGLLSGQWGTAKTFVVIDLSAAIATGQPFLQKAVKRQSGVLLIAAEGASQVRLRFDAVWKEKCGNGQERAPFVWYETAPPLLQKGSVEKLIAMARQAEAVLMKDFGLPLGLIIIDTLTACSGYRRSGEDNDNAVAAALMGILGAVAQTIDCFVLGVAHFGKDVEAGTTGAMAKENAADVILACLGHKELSGAVTNTRLAVRKNRGGLQGQQHPFTLRLVDMGQDEDGEPETTTVVDWSPPGTAAEAAAPADDPWSKAKRQDQRTAALRLKRVLMTILAEQGVDLPISPDGPEVRMVDQKLVRKAFYACTPADGTPEQKGRFRRQKFLAALDWAEQNQLIGAGDINEVSYLWLARLEPEDEEEG